ncbi:MAG TPA: adenylate/guanylate cyclase domain-containing protein [Bryobacteraceae bacterium]|nr:adenylate/guanylate cyclase domain-containing protein [Bryobacteraceae bacterium]
MSKAEVYLAVPTPQEMHKLNLNGGGYWTIGRDADNSFVFNDQSMSRRHAVIQQMQAGKYFFIDLGSRNGSMINGRRVTVPLEMQDGDSLVCGQTEMIFHCPASEPESERAQSAATNILYARRVITVLVVDIRDFTRLTQQLDPGVLAQAIGTWFREAGQIIRRHCSSGGKYIGDAVMAVWTHPTETPEPSEMRRILQALADIRSLTAGLHQQFPLPGPVRIGAGINTGLSIVGNTGGLDSPEFSPLGDNVNAAFRLETATKGVGVDIALGKMTFDCLGADPDPQQYFEKRAVQLKGYDHAVEAWLTSFESLEAYLKNSR